MKSKVCVLVALLLLIMIPISSLASTMYVNTANGKSLNMRGNALTGVDNIIQQIPYGAAVEVLSFYESDFWALIKYDGKNGYVMTRYLDVKKPAKKQPAQNSVAKKNMYDGFVVASYEVSVKPATPTGVANLRWAPDKSAPLNAVYHAGAKLTVIAENGEWAQVYDADKGICGFMAMKFLH